PIVQILGINAFMFVYNVSGYHLRHSHVWLRWPGPLAYLFGCPAHHQIHHSCKPEHINKNMAFMFPIWDVLFRTFHLPKEREEMVFGIGDGSEGEYKGFFSIYLRPFVELFVEKPKAKNREDTNLPSDSEAHVSNEPPTAMDTRAAS
ncbi:MAG: sterol desaturase family protein, partial [Pirellulales bacterium]|nr:sterol desaturase family protein [Pirellulales bacterium]